VVKSALSYNASAVIFAHNHPSGSLQVSDSDKALTSILVNALSTVEIPVLDHIVIGEGGYTSLSQLGLL
jgi:DNA repair protein RadC